MIDPELRERLARAGFDAFWAEGTTHSEIERTMWLQVADATLAEIAAAGCSVVETESLERLRAVARTARTDLDDDDLDDALDALTPADLGDPD